MDNKILQEKDQDLKGKQWVDEYNNLISRVNKRREELCKLQSQCDSEQDDILHYIEMKKCDAIVSSRLMKKLKEIREQRRVIKEELAALDSISMLSKTSKYKNNTTYVFKTNVIIDLLEEGKENWYGSRICER